MVDLILAIIGAPLGLIMWAYNQLFNNFGISIILFTLATRELLLPRYRRIRIGGCNVFN